MTRGVGKSRPKNGPSRVTELLNGRYVFTKIETDDWRHRALDAPESSASLNRRQSSCIGTTKHFQAHLDLLLRVVWSACTWMTESVRSPLDTFRDILSVSVALKSQRERTFIEHISIWVNWESPVQKCKNFPLVPFERSPTSKYF